MHLIVVFTGIDWLSDFMKGHYHHVRLKKRREEKDPWPPIATSSYITLALMYQKGLQTSTETAETIFLRTKGDACEIPKKLSFQKLTEIAQIFNSKSGQIPNVILIEGQPGIGKTTLVKEICSEWANGKLLRSEKLVLLLLLRGPNVQKITTVQQVIEYFTEFKAKDIYTNILETNGAGITLIIDGFDELSGRLQTKSFFTDLVEKKVLPKARILVTSRPTASTCFYHTIDRRIEILGFDQASRLEYANDALQDFPSKLKKLQKHFQQYPNIDAICYIPLIMHVHHCIPLFVSTREPPFNSFYNVSKFCLTHNLSLLETNRGAL